MTDDGNDKPSNTQSSNPGGGKDVLFGWLVGRAAADLGLAQALAASEAQRAEQFKRLEDSLLAQIRELQNHSNLAIGLTDPTVELHELKAEMQSIFARMGGLESVAQQFSQTPDLLKTEVAALRSQLGERQSLIDTQYSRFEKNAANLGARIQELEHQISSTPQSLDRAVGELADFKLELRALADRIAGAEFSTQQIHTQTAGEIQRAQGLAADLIKGESATLKAEIFEQLRHHQPADSIVQTFEEKLQRRVDELRHEIDQNTKSFTNLAVELSPLRSQLQRLTQQMESAAAVPAPAVDFAAEGARLSQETEDRVSGRIREFGDEISRQLHEIGEFKVDRKHFNAEIDTLADRITNLERAAEQTGAGLRIELNSLKTELSQQLNRQQPAEALLKRVEETLRTKIEEIQDHLAQEQQSRRDHDVQQRAFETHLERFGQRMKDIESMAQQTHALMINETTQAAQQRDGVAAELATLRAQLGDAQSRNAAVRGVQETLSARIQELQNQLTQRMPSLDQRDTELRELKAQVQNFTQQTARVGTDLAPSQLSVASRTPEHAVLPLATPARHTAPEDRPGSAPPKLELDKSGPQEPQPEIDAPKDRLLVEGEDALKLLHARMTADIERARAELREKSGRWKVRR